MYVHFYMHAYAHFFQIPPSASSSIFYTTQLRQKSSRLFDLPQHSQVLQNVRMDVNPDIPAVFLLGLWHLLRIFGIVNSSVPVYHCRYANHQVWRILTLDLTTIAAPEQIQSIHSQWSLTCKHPDTEIPSYTKQHFWDWCDRVIFGSFNVIFLALLIRIKQVIRVILALVRTNNEESADGAVNAKHFQKGMPSKLIILTVSIPDPML